jgi:hypothetical protein
MSLLNDLKADLLGRRLLPVFALLAVGLVAALAYALLGGGSGSSSPVASAPLGAPSVSASRHLATPTPSNPNALASETVSGTAYQREGGAHDPFIQLPVPVAKTTSTAPSTTKSSAPSKSSSEPPTRVATETPTSKVETKNPKPRVVYEVTVDFGPVAPAGQPSQLQTYPDLKRLTPLPSAATPLVVYAGVSKSGRGALFTVVGEAILKGTGVCVPSATSCESIELAAGKTEELEAINSVGQPVLYELKIEKIEKRSTTVAVAGRVRNRVSRAGRLLLRREGLTHVTGVRYLPATGLLEVRHGF